MNRQYQTVMHMGEPQNLQDTTETTPEPDVGMDDIRQ